MPRIKIDGYPIGCPAVHGEGYCPFCGGGWPGTKSPSESLIKSAREFKLKPENLGCGPLTDQGRFLVKHFFWNGKEVRITGEEINGENDFGVGPVGGGIYGPVMVNLIAGSDLEKKKVSEEQSTDEAQVGPLVILVLNGE